MGAGDRTFRIFKFRTMDADADERKQQVAHLNRHLGEGGDPRMFKIADDPRVTRVGRFLRRYSLDELPQLINVLRGEMCSSARDRSSSTRTSTSTTGRAGASTCVPGITGLWQVLGRSAIPFEEMVELDYLYVTNWSLVQRPQADPADGPGILCRPHTG